MFNHCLATLDNDPTPPDGFLWPSFSPFTPSQAEQSVRAAIIGLNLSREQKFARCLQLVDLLAQSPLSNYLTIIDPRIAYTRDSILARFAMFGVAVQYAGSRMSPPAVTLAVMATTPEIGAWTLRPVSPSSITIADDRGATSTVSVTFSGGMSSPIPLPNNAGIVQLIGTDIAANDLWYLSYRAAGASWVEEALTRLATIDPRAAMPPELIAWYDKAPLALDQLAAVIAALGS